jgi:MerR family mercuric resistance operon transcriptional regulator
LKFVKSAQRLGFSLDEVAQLLRLDDGAHCREAARLAAARLADVRARLADLQRMESALSVLVEACRTQRGRVSCPLIAALH